MPRRRLEGKASHGLIDDRRVHAKNVIARNLKSEVLKEGRCDEDGLLPWFAKVLPKPAVALTLREGKEGIARPRRPRLRIKYNYYTDISE